MATLQEIVNKAFREVGITAVGASPETAEYTESLALLQSISLSLIGSEMGENLTTINVGSGNNLNTSAQALDATTEITSLYIPDNVIIACNLTAPLTLYLHPKPRNGDRVLIQDMAGNFNVNNVTLQGNGRPINTGGSGVSSVILSTASSSVSYFYRQDTGMWTSFDISVDTALPPWNTAFDDLFIYMLAKRLAPRYGANWTDTQ